MRMSASAAKHGVSDQDALHAERSAFVLIREEAKDGDAWFVLKIGFGIAGEFIEVGVLNPYTDPEIIHAMKLRRNYHRFIPEHLRK